MVCDLDDDEIAILEEELKERLQRDIDIDVMIPVRVAVQVLEATGRKKTKADADRIRELLIEHFRVPENGSLTVAWLFNLAYLMDNPLVKLGWRPCNYEPQTGMANDVPAKLCEYLAENPRLSFFVTPDVHFTD